MLTIYVVLVVPIRMMLLVLLWMTLFGLMSRFLKMTGRPTGLRALPMAFPTYMSCENMGRLSLTRLVALWMLELAISVVSFPERTVAFSMLLKALVLPSLFVSMISMLLVRVQRTVIRSTRPLRGVYMMAMVSL